MTREMVRNGVDIASIVTLDWLYERCKEVDGCLVWQLACAHGSDPQAKVGGRAGPIILVRRVLWELRRERAFPFGKVAIVSCGTDKCVHPDHIIAAKKNASQVGRALTLAHRAKLAASRRANSTLSDEAVAEIRASDESPADLADRHGIHPTYVRYIQIGRSRRDYRDPFAQLGARA